MGSDGVQKLISVVAYEDVTLQDTSLSKRKSEQSNNSSGGLLQQNLNMFAKRDFFEWPEKPFTLFTLISSKLYFPHQ